MEHAASFIKQNIPWRPIQCTACYVAIFILLFIGVTKGKKNTIEEKEISLAWDCNWYAFFQNLQANRILVF